MRLRHVFTDGVDLLAMFQSVFDGRNSTSKILDRETRMIGQDKRPGCRAICQYGLGPCA
jgi:hypothetical protein